MNTNRHVIHIDMDAFFASVEQLDNPELKGKPVIVGGSVQQRGVVAAASYEARKYGVHSAMPMSKAVKLCPDAVILPVRMKRYAEISRQIHKIFSNYTPEIEPISLDEAFLDVTGSINLFGSSEKIGIEIKNKIKEQLNLTASVGIAPNKFLAKLGSDLEKPDGFVVITEENKQAILDPLPVSEIWGIGKVTTKELQSKGIHTVKQLRLTHTKILNSIFGNCSQEIINLAQGIDDRPVESERETKSISAEETFPEDIGDKDILLNILHNQVDEVSQRLRADRLECKTITLKLRYGDFKTITRSSTFNNPTNITQKLLHESNKVFSNWYKQSADKLRLLGFGVSSLSVEGSGQQLLFEDKEEKKHKELDQTIDKIKNKYGDNAFNRG